MCGPAAEHRLKPVLLKTSVHRNAIRRGKLTGKPDPALTLEISGLVRNRVLPWFGKPKTRDESDRVGEKSHNARRVSELPCNRTSRHVQHNRGRDESR
jgi:hypothetical protein